MKTLHTLSAVITLSISTFSHAENTTPQNENSLTISVLEVKKPTCNGAANASILIEVNGGTLPYHYNWNTFPAQSSPMATNLTKGIYFIQVTDANGLVTYKSVEITDPINTIVNPISISSLVSQSVTVISENENEEFTYYLDGQKIEEPVVTGLDIGIHKLTITNQNDCTLEQFIQIVELESDSINSEKNKTEILVSSLITTDEFNTITLMQDK